MPPTPNESVHPCGAPFHAKDQDLSIRTNKALTSDVPVSPIHSGNTQLSGSSSFTAGMQKSSSARKVERQPHDGFLDRRYSAQTMRSPLSHHSLQDTIHNSKLVQESVQILEKALAKDDRQSNKVTLTRQEALVCQRALITVLDPKVDDVTHRVHMLPDDVKQYILHEFADSIDFRRLHSAHSMRSITSSQASSHSFPLNLGSPSSGSPRTFYSSRYDLFESSDRSRAFSGNDMDFLDTNLVKQVILSDEEMTISDDESASERIKADFGVKDADKDLYAEDAKLEGEEIKVSSGDSPKETVHPIRRSNTIEMSPRMRFPSQGSPRRFSGLRKLQTASKLYHARKLKSERLLEKIEGNSGSSDASRRAAHDEEVVKVSDGLLQNTNSGEIDRKSEQGHWKEEHSPKQVESDEHHREAAVGQPHQKATEHLDRPIKQQPQAHEEEEEEEEVQFFKGTSQLNLADVPVIASPGPSASAKDTVQLGGSTIDSTILALESLTLKSTKAVPPLVFSKSDAPPRRAMLHKRSGSMSPPVANASMKKTLVWTICKGENKDEEMNCETTDESVEPQVPESALPLVEMLSQICEWDNFDVFEVNRLADKGVLVVTGFAVFERHGFFETLGLPCVETLAYLEALQGRYLDNPYHNAIHAADVGQTMSHFFLRCGMAKYANDLTRFAALFAAFAHDVAHPGVTNGFLVSTWDQLALRYNDRSPLEMMHTAVAFELFQKPNCNMLICLDHCDRVVFRKAVISLILATDNAEHDLLLGRLDKVAQALQSSSKHNVLVADHEQIIILEAGLHAADISSSGKPWELYQQWTQRLCTEFRQQGDLEKERGLPVLPFMDRNLELPISRFQSGFINAIVQPLYEGLNNIVDLNLSHCLSILDQNLAKWESWPSNAFDDTKPDSGQCVSSPSSRASQSPNEPAWSSMPHAPKPNSA